MRTARASGRRRVPEQATARHAFGPPRLAVLLDPRRAEAVALGTGAVLLAPREQTRVGGGEARAAARARAPGRVEALGGARHHHRAAAEIQSPRDGLFQPPTLVGRAGGARLRSLSGQPLDHRLDVVDLETVDPWRPCRVVERAVDPHLGDALLRHGGDRVEVVALPPADEGREDRELAGGEVLRDARGEGRGVHHLPGQPALRAVHGPQSRPEEAQVVVDLARGAHGRQRRPARELLLQGDGGRHALEAVHLGAGERADELAHVGREAVEKAPLALGEEDVEGEGGLAGAGDAGDRHQLVARDVHRDPLQVVLARADDADAVRAAPARVVGVERARRELPSPSPRGPSPHSREGPGESPPGRRVEPRDLLRRPLSDDPAALVARLGTEVEDPVGGESHLRVVLDDDDGVAGLHEPVHGPDEHGHVRGVEAGRRLVEQVEPPRRRARLGERPRELEPLRLAARERRRRLGERQVAEAEVEHRLEGRAEPGGVPEEASDVGRGQVERVRDREAQATHLEHLGSEATAVAGPALHEGVGQELHLDLLVARALADRARPGRGVEREGGGLEAALAGLGRLREGLAQGLQDAHVGRRVHAGGRAERRLVHERDPGEQGRPVDPVARPGLGLAEAEVPAQVPVEHLVHERGLARARDSGHAHEEAERHSHRHVLEVVLARAADDEAPRGVGPSSPGRARHHEPAREVIPRLRAGLGEEARDRPLVHHLAALASGPGAEVDHVVGRGDQGRVVLDHHHGVARVGQPAQHARRAGRRRAGAGPPTARRGRRACS